MGSASVGGDSPELRKKKVTLAFEWIHCSNEHSFLVLNGGLFATGKDAKNRLGFKSQQTLGQELHRFKKPALHKLSRLPLLSVVGVASSTEHTLAWTKDGSLFSWGDATDGKLGRPIDDLGYFGVREAGLVHLPDQVTMAACGENYSIALTLKGEIYTWGK